jgi:branched-chain amino acid transport system substrate-binding protein
MGNLEKSFQGGLSRRNFLKLSALFASSALLTSCTTASETGAVTEVKVAVIEPLTGLAGAIGSKSANGVELAVKEINENGGIAALDGAKIVVTRYDTQSDAKIAKTVAEKAISDGNIAIIGSAHTASALVLTEVAEKASVPILVTVAQADNITDRGYKYTFSVTPTTSQISASAVGMLKELPNGPKKIGHLYEDTSYGQGIQAWYEANLPNEGFEFVGGLSYPANAPDVTSIVSKLKSMNPDFVFVSSYFEDAVLIMRAFKDLDFNTLGVHNSSADSDEFITTLADLSEYVYLNMYWSPDSAIPGAEDGRGVKVDEAYRAAYGESMAGYSVLGFTSAYVMKAALESAAEMTSPAVRDAIASVNLTGADGIIMPVESLAFDEKGRNKEAKVLVGQIQNAKRVAVWPESFATGEVLFPTPNWTERK